MSVARPLLAVALSLAAAAVSAAPPVFTASEMMRLGRLSDPQPSPDGTQLAYALQEIDLAAGTRNTDLWLAPLAGGEPRRLAASPASESHPRWSRDGRRLGFVSTRGGAAQVWAVDPRGGEPQQLTSLATGVESFEWLDDARLLVVARVHPDCGADDACNKQRLEAEGKRGSARANDEQL
jgi:Tol biopolymer transport system component